MELSEAKRKMFNQLAMDERFTHRRTEMPFLHCSSKALKDLWTYLYGVSVTSRDEEYNHVQVDEKKN